MKARARWTMQTYTNGGPRTDEYGGEIFNSGENSGGPEFYILEETDQLPSSLFFFYRVRKVNFNSDKVKFRVRATVNARSCISAPWKAPTTGTRSRPPRPTGFCTPAAGARRRSSTS
jgi:hypothetical protein